MIKTNRFVKIVSVRGLPLRLVVNSLRVPIVSEDPSTVDKFKGYVLELSLGCTKPMRLPIGHESEYLLRPCTLMILFRDLDRFCQSLTDGDAHTTGFTRVIKLLVKVAPLLETTSRVTIDPLFEDFFSIKTQRLLLAPLRAHLKGYKVLRLRVE